MTTKEAKKRAGRPALHQFVSTTEIAETLRCTPQAVRLWVDKGDFPPPWLRPGTGTWLWRLDHFQSYCDGRGWPNEAFPAIQDDES